MKHGPFSGISNVHGVTYDGQNVWFAAGETLNALDPASGKMLRSINVAADAGTAFDGQHLFQLADRSGYRKSIRRPAVCSRRSPCPPVAATQGSRGPKGRSGSGSMRTGRSIKWIPKQARFFARSSPTRFVTGVTWIEGELWHGTWEDDESDLRRVDPRTGELLERLEMPPGVGVSGARV